MASKQQKRREYIEQAQHLTYIDTLNHQKLLRKRIERLIEKKGHITPTERSSFLEELSKALFGMGTLEEIYLEVEKGLVPLGNLHYFGEKLSYIHSNTVDIKYKGKKYTVPIDVLWKLFLEHLLVVFPFAQREAHMRSAEREYYEPGGTLEYLPKRRY